MATLIIEELNRNHKLLSRHKFQTTDIHLGRGYHNDIIINDPHVCAEHLQIHFDGQHWIIRDLNSINGSFVNNKKTPANNHIVQSGDIINLGNSRVRLVFPEHPVATSIRFSQFESLITFAKHPMSIFASILLFSLVNGYLIYLAKPEEIKVVQLITQLLAINFVLALWPLGVALIAHLTKNDARIWPQIGITFLIYNLFWLTDFAENVLLFNSTEHILVTLLLIIMPASIGFMLFWLNCYVGFNMSPSKRNLTALGLVVLFFGGSELKELSKQPDFNVNPSYNSTIMPPSYLLRSGSKTDVFIHDAKAIFAKARTSAEENMTK